MPICIPDQCAECIEPPKSSGEEIILTSIAPEAHVPFITAATLFLNGSNDHHGGHERGLESFKKFPKDVPWSFAIQARGHHDRVGTQRQRTPRPVPRHQCDPARLRRKDRDQGCGACAERCGLAAQDWNRRRVDELLKFDTLAIAHADCG